MESKKNYKKYFLFFLTFVFLLPLVATRPVQMLPGGNVSAGNNVSEVDSWKGSFTIQYRGITEWKNPDNPNLGHKFQFDHSITVRFTTAEGMVSNPKESELGISEGTEGDIMKQMQSGQLDVEALQKMADNIEASGMGTSKVMSWTASDGFEGTEIPNGTVSVEMTASDKTHEVLQDVGEGYCCTITQEATWNGKQTTKDFYILLIVNEVSEKYHMEVKWSNVLPSVEYSYDFINLKKCPGWSYSCDPPKDYSEAQENYLPLNMRTRTTEVKDPLQDLTLDDPDRLKGSKTLRGLYEIDDTPVDVIISWDIQRTR